MKELIGRQIQGLFVNEDQSLLVFVTDQGALAYRAVGDCCSETWFADIMGVIAAVRPGTVVTDVEEMSVPPIVARAYAFDGRTRQEIDAVYGYRIVLNRFSHLDVVYRNSSNGYYGGYCALDTRPEALAEPLIAITTDEWSAS